MQLKSPFTIYGDFSEPEKAILNDIVIQENARNFFQTKHPNVLENGIWC